MKSVRNKWKPYRSWLFCFFFLLAFIYLPLQCHNHPKRSLPEPNVPFKRPRRGDGFARYKSVYRRTRGIQPTPQQQGTHPIRRARRRSKLTVRKGRVPQAKPRIVPISPSVRTISSCLPVMPVIEDDIQQGSVTSVDPQTEQGPCPGATVGEELGENGTMDVGGGNLQPLCSASTWRVFWGWRSWSCFQKHMLGVLAWQESNGKCCR